MFKLETVNEIGNRIEMDPFEPPHNCAGVLVSYFTGHIGFSFVGMVYSTTSSVEYKNGYILLSV